jgi:ketosteroid isomerase-like protein
MWKSVLLGILGLVAVLLMSAQPARPAGREDGGERGSEREVRELEGQFARAAVRGDRAFYERALADDFTHTSHSGVFKTRAQWLAEAKGGDPAEAKPGTTHYEALDVDDLAVRVYGDTAVVTGRTTPRGTTAKGQPMTGRYRFLRVWVKRQGRWQAVAFEGTRIAQP